VEEGEAGSLQPSARGGTEHTTHDGKDSRRINHNREAISDQKWAQGPGINCTEWAGGAPWRAAQDALFFGGAGGANPKTDRAGWGWHGAAPNPPKPQGANEPRGERMRARRAGRG
jgi:hypothetical protein